MLMSFPHGTKADDVRDIASDVCERFFETDEGHFDYVIAIPQGSRSPARTYRPEPAIPGGRVLLFGPGSSVQL